MTKLPIGPDGGERSPWIATSTGGKFRPLTPQMCDVMIDDIARGLSRRVRFSGQTKGDGPGYTVAEHSMAVAGRFEVHNRATYDRAMWGLLHDAAEAWLPDVASPLKPYTFVAVPEGEAFALKPFAAIEEQILEVVGLRFAVTWPIPPEVFEADTRELARERRELMEDQTEVWESLCGVEAYPEPLEPIGDAAEIERRFIEVFFRLRKERWG